MRRLCLLFCVSLWLAGCGGPSGEYVRKGPRKPIPPQTLRLLEEFELLTSAGDRKPYRIAGPEISPFGAVLHIPPRGTYGVCSGTHIRQGVVVTSAHCLSTANLDYLFAVFYDKHGTKTFARIESGAYAQYKYEDFHLIHDIAVLRITPADADRWDALEANVITDTAMWAGAATKAVTLWAHDPIVRHKSLRRRYGDDGMVFSRKTCRAGIMPPKLWGIPDKDKPNEKRERIGVGLSEKYHLTLEACSSLPVQGNSGALITLAAAPQQAVGLFAGYTDMPDDLIAKYKHFVYSNLLGTEMVKKFPDDFPDKRVVSAAYRFQISLDGYLNDEKFSVEKPAEEADKSAVITEAP